MTGTHPPSTSGHLCLANSPWYSMNVVWVVVTYYLLDAVWVVGCHIVSFRGLWLEGAGQVQDQYKCNWSEYFSSSVSQPECLLLPLSYILGSVWMASAYAFMLLFYFQQFIVLEEHNGKNLFYLYMVLPSLVLIILFCTSWFPSGITFVQPKELSLTISITYSEGQLSNSPGCQKTWFLWEGLK